MMNDYQKYISDSRADSEARAAAGWQALWAGLPIPENCNEESLARWERENERRRSGEKSYIELFGRVQRAVISSFFFFSLAPVLLGIALGFGFSSPALFIGGASFSLFSFGLSQHLGLSGQRILAKKITHRLGK